jgi:sterol O-acyltransferase
MPQPHNLAVLEELEANQVVLDNGKINNAALPSPSDRAQPIRLAPPDISSEDDWSAEHSSLEDYDAVTADMATIMEDSVGGDMKAGYHTSTVASGDTSSTKTEKGNQRNHSDPSMIQKEMLESRSVRRQNIQIILEKTDKKGRYILTADDPELREILKAGLEREAQGRENEFAGKNGRKRFRDLVFTRRFTTFDRQNPQNAESRFHGFFTLFWIAMGLLLARIAAQNWKVYGSMLGNAEILHMMLDRDVILLGITDAVMCLATVFGVLLQLLILKGYLSWNRSGWIIQNIWQTLYLAACVGWTYYRDWPWTHTIFIVLHCLVFVMKQHSYAFYNGYRKWCLVKTGNFVNVETVSQVYRRRKILEQKLAQLENMEPIPSLATGATPAQYFPSTVSGITATGIDSSTTSPKKTITERKPGMNSPLQPHPPPLSRKNSLTERRRSVAAKASTNLNKERSEISSIAWAIDKGEPLDNSQMEAFSRIIHSEIRSLNEDLNGKSTSGANSYPKNLTLANWADWTCLPTLVYELEYPRQEKINWWYVAEKTAATFGVIWIMMVCSTHKNLASRNLTHCPLGNFTGLHLPSRH